jgi:ribosomal protein L28
VPAAARIYRLNPVKDRFLARGTKATLKLRVSAKTLKAIKRALRKHERVTANIKVTIRDALGNRASMKSLASTSEAILSQRLPAAPPDDPDAVFRQPPPPPRTVAPMLGINPDLMGTAATIYGVGAAAAALLQTRQILRSKSRARSPHASSPATPAATQSGCSTA